MKDKYHEVVSKTLIFIIDFWLIHLAFTLTRDLGVDPGSSGRKEVTLFFLIFTLIWIIAGFFFKIYRIDLVSLTRNISINLLATFLAHMVMIFAILRGFNIFSIDVNFLSCVYIIAAVLIIGSRILYKLILKYFEFTGFNKRKVIIVGATGSGRALYQFFDTHKSAGYEFKGFFDDRRPKKSYDRKLIAGKLRDIKEFCTCERIDEMYVTLPPPTCKELIEDLLKFADDNFIYFRIAPDFGQFTKGNCQLSLINSVPVLSASKEPLSISLNSTLQRALDIVFSLAVICTVFPFIVPLIALWIRLDSKGPIICKDLRPGKRNKLFDVYKFRTTRVNNNMEIQPTSDDACMTRVGRFLRKTHLDELPQFFNVLLGNMSLVGPRPNMVTQHNKYSGTIQHDKIRQLITPGITRYAS